MLSLDSRGSKPHNEGVGKPRDLLVKPAAMAGLTLLLYASLSGRLDGLERRIDALHGDVRLLSEAHLPPESPAQLGGPTRPRKEDRPMPPHPDRRSWWDIGVAPCIQPPAWSINARRLHRAQRRGNAARVRAHRYAHSAAALAADQSQADRAVRAAWDALALCIFPL